MNTHCYQCANTTISILVTILLCVISGNSHALTYEWPLVSGMTYETTNGGASSSVTLQITYVTVTDNSLPENATVNDVLSKHNNLSASNAFFGAYYRYDYCVGCEDPVPYLATPVRTGSPGSIVLWRDYASQIKNFFGSSYNLVVLNTRRYGMCVGLAFFKASDHSTPYATWAARSWDGVNDTGIDCIGLPPPNEYCALTVPMISLEYGSIPTKRAEGALKSTNIGIECTTALKYTLRLQGLEQDRVNLSNGMSATLKAGGAPLRTTLQGVPGYQTVLLESTLVGTPQKSGSFSGMGVLYVSYP